MKKIGNVLLAAVVGAILVSVSSCASIISRSSYPVDLNSMPQGAAVTVENRDGRTIFVGKTPTTLWLEASAGYMRPEIYRVTYRQPGQQPVETYIEAKIDGAYFANLLLVPAAWVGMLVVDPLTGAMWRIPQGAEVVSVTDGAAASRAEAIAAPAVETTKTSEWSTLGD